MVHDWRGNLEPGLGEQTQPVQRNFAAKLGFLGIVFRGREGYPFCDVTCS